MFLRFSVVAILRTPLDLWANISFGGTLAPWRTAVKEIHTKNITLNLKRP